MQFRKQAALFRKHGVRFLAITTACAALSACAFAPGMRMIEPATLPATSGNAQTPATNVQVPITDITSSLIKEMRDAADKAGAAEGRGLFESSGPYTYRLGIGDVLEITVWDHPELAAALGAQQQSTTRASDPMAGFIIDQRGNLSFPYIGTLHVEGLRTDEVQRALSERLGQVFVRPQVTVRIASFRSQQVYVDGEVHVPGPQPINDIPMTLYDAVSRAGGFSPTADQSRMVLVRDGVSHPLNLPQLLANGQNPSRIILKNGDLLRVVSRDDNGVYVMGEVVKPSTAIPMKNGRLSLSEAISQTGSLNNTTADASQLYVIRGSQDVNPQVFHLDARSPVSMILANQFELQPKDVVYIDGNGLVRLSRVLNLLIPAINASLYGAVVAK
ncbi:polysaccharide biosynthesis/export family protein [Paraburkholderia phenazinium]|jgi:polysaccharide export outer membrane protein|uniref:Polysaccharide export outer membrane protein n=1 Tax=Paraburkholderia phenazinium TaxID=60549 RepID=A0A1G7S613_9BURK|nr:polysaccharide biosynthesis/export family protein [Paraburkholderia phenazinium]SDG18457.1 polysaccharide export outer membrane protein [Paraburkholderia phenazinium]